MTTPTLRARLKQVQAMVFSAIEHPYVPASVRAAVAEIALLLADLVDRVEKLEKERERSDGN